MESFIIYIIKVAVCLGVFLSIYAIFLRKTTFFKFNRFFLIAGFVASLVIPSIKPTYDVVISIPATVMNTMAEGSVPVVETSVPSFSPWYLLITIYVIGILLFVIRNIYSYLKISRLIKNGTKTKNDGFVLIENMSIKSAFTVLHYILLNPSLLSKTEKDLILKHELTHINQKHWVDLLCSECMLLLQWFNPLAWIYVRLLKENHEFLADKAVIDSGISPYLYQAVMINQEFQGPVFSFSNSFNYSNPLNRLSMIKKEKSASWKRFAALAIIPMFGLFLWASAEPNYIVKSPIDLSTNDTIPQVVTYEIQMKDEGSTGEVKDYQFFITENDDSRQDGVATYHFKIDASTKDSIKQKSSIHIRGMGNKKPLIIIDGKKVADMGDINPDDIASFNVLKYKSAIDIYGEEGKNGVIVISTQKGDKKGSAIKGKVKKIYINNKTDDGKVSKSSVVVHSLNSTDKKPLIIVDGETVDNMDDLNTYHIKSVDIIKDSISVLEYGEKGKNGVIVVSTKDGDDGKLKGKVQTVLIKKNGNDTASVFLNGGYSSINGKKPLILVDGEKTESIDDIKVDDIESFSILKDKAATETYGEEAKDGVILITTKKNKKD